MDQTGTQAGTGVAYLVAEAGGLRQVYGLTLETTRIGRVASNEIPLPFSTVSRTHAVVVKTPMGFKIQDQQSRNGLTVNDIRVMEKFLVEGDRVQIGEVRLLFTRRDPAQEENKDTGTMPAITSPPSEHLTRRKLQAPEERRAAAPALLLPAMVGALAGFVVALFVAAGRPKATPDVSEIREELKDVIRLEASATHRRQDDKIETFLSFHRDENERLRAQNQKLIDEIGVLNMQLLDLETRLSILSRRLEELSNARPEPAPAPAPQPPVPTPDPPLPTPIPIPIPPPGPDDGPGGGVL